MKKFLLLLMALPTMAFANVIEEDNDTTIVINNPDKVVINQNDSKLSIEVNGSKDNPDYYYKNEMNSSGDAYFFSEESQSDWNFKLPFVKSKNEKCNKHYSDHVDMGGFGVGLVSAVNAAQGVKVDMGASFEFMLDHLISWEYYPWKNGSSFSIGLGLNWKNYRMTSREMFVKRGDNIVIDSYPQGADIQFSRIKVFSLTVPLTFTQQLYDRIYLSLGPVVNFNTHASLKTRYKDNGNKVKITDNNVHQSPITVDFMANLRFKSVGVYVKYSPNNVLDTDYAPKFQSLSAGLTFFY